MDETPLYLTIKEASDGELFFEVPEAMWQELIHLGWRIGDDLDFEAKKGNIEIINPSASKRRSNN